MLVFKIADARAVRGGKAILAFDGDGNQLPGQMGCVVEQDAAELTVISVKFLVDGKNVRLASE